MPLTDPMTPQRLREIVREGMLNPYGRMSQELLAHADQLERNAELPWLRYPDHEPYTNQIVVVHGGIAQYRAGEFYTGMEWPQYARKIQWPVTHWFALPKPPEPISTAPKPNDLPYSPSPDGRCERCDRIIGREAK